jgi:exosome complex component RRP42
MTSIKLSNADYVKQLLKNNERDDKRGFMEYRTINIINGFIPNAEGSARVKLGYTDVLAGVKLGVEEPMPDKPNEGNLMVSAELLPMASETYEAGPPTPEAIELSRVIDRGIRAASAVDLSKLFIEEGKVWTAFIDVYVINYDGNLFDAGELAAMSALMNTKMPKYEDGKIIKEESTGKLPIGNLVTSCTFAKIGKSILLDPTGLEEEIMSARLTVANDDKYMRAMQKGIKGSFTGEEVEMLIDTSFEKSKQLRKVLDENKVD